MTEKREITIILAPLQGYTDVVYRNVFARHFKGVDEAIAPFLSTMAQQSPKPSKINEVIPENNQHLPTIPQILGNSSTDFIWLANHLHQLGHEKINWNLGCPHSKVAKKLKGSGLLMYPEKIDAFLDHVLPNISSSLSIKLRLGRKSKNEIFKVLSVLENYPLDEIILHARTGIQMYQGTCDLEAFAGALDSSSHKFVYNGDIVNKAFFEKITTKFGQISRFMIGRGLLADPFLAETIKGIQLDSTHEKHDRLQKFHADLFENYQTRFSGPGHLVGRMKGLWRYLAGGCFQNRPRQLKKILRARSTDQYLERVEQMFDGQL